VPRVTGWAGIACYVRAVKLARLRAQALALVMAVAAWSGCATAHAPLVDPALTSGAYVPARIAVLPPDVFIVLDQVGDNDPAQSAALGQTVSTETVQLVEKALRARGYDVDLSARWDGILAADGSVLVSRDELGWLANGVLQFGNSPDGSGQGALARPIYVAPELAAKVGWATRSDAVLYLNVKGVTTTAGKRAASILAGVFIVAIVAVVILALVANSKGGGSGSPSLGGSGFRGQPVARAAPSSAFHGTPPVGHAALMPSGGGFRGAPAAGAPRVAPGGGGWRGGGPTALAPHPPGRVFAGGPHVAFGVGVVVPLDGPVYTHDGDVQHEDEVFAGDELYASMTLVSTDDGRVLWHARQPLDLDAEDQQDVARMVDDFLASMPPRGGWPAPAPK